MFSLLILSSFSFAQDPNWPLRLRPGVLQTMTVSNAPAYRFAGYCAAGQGDVSISFGGLSFTAPCHDVLGVYRVDGDVSAETNVNPVRQCVTQGASPLICSGYSENELAPPGLAFQSTPLLKITLSNSVSYIIRGDCAPVGSNISIDVGASTSVISGVCGAGGKFNLSGDVSAVPDGIGISVNADVENGGVMSSFPNTVTKGLVAVSINPSTPINLSNESSYSLSGTCSEEGREITLNIGGLTPSSQPTCSSSNWSVSGFDVSSIGDATYILTADHADHLGALAIQATENVLKDTVSPVVTLGTVIDINFDNENAYVLEGTCSDSGEDVQFNFEGLLSSAVCTLGVWTETFDVSSLAEGVSTLTVDHSDAAGNPAVQISSPVTKAVYDLLTEVSGIRLWLDGQDGSTLWQDSSCSVTPADTNGDLVACWQDKSGNDSHALQINASRMAALDVDGHLYFDGADSYDAGNTMPGVTTEHNTFIVHKEVVRTSHTDLNFNHPSTGCSSNTAVTDRVSMHTPWGNGRIYWDSGSCSGFRRVNVGSFVTTGVRVQYGFENSVSKSSQFISQNGAVIVSDTSGHTLNITGITRIGGDTGMGGGLNGEISELLVTNQALSLSDIQDIEGYLACKWNMRDSLLVSHPYFHADPLSSEGCP